MKVVVQRCLRANCIIDGNVHSSIGRGLMLLVGFTNNDNLEIIKKMSKKIINLRIFEDENNKMNKSIIDIGGEILSISQFTLYANPYNGNRPSFTEALNFSDANNLYKEFNEVLRSENNIKVEEGIFGADMKIDFVNDGPVTIIIDSMNFK